MKKLSEKPFALLGVNSDEDREALKQTMIEHDITWRSWWDAGSIDGPIHTRWQIVERPAIHLLDASGIIRHRNIHPDEVGDVIDKLLAELSSKKDEPVPMID